MERMTVHGPLYMFNVKQEILMTVNVLHNFSVFTWLPADQTVCLCSFLNYLAHTLHILIYWLTYSTEQSPWEANQFSTSQKFPAFYGTRRFITAFTNAPHLSLSWASSIQSIPPPPTSWRSILILSYHLHLGLPSGLFPAGFPTKTLYTPLLSPIRTTCPHLSHSSQFYYLNNIG